MRIRRRRAADDVLGNEIPVLGRKNWPTENPLVANYRGLGLADMARAIAEGRPHRASAEMSLHTLAVISGIVESAERGVDVDITEPCLRPNAMTEADAKELLVADSPR